MTVMLSSEFLVSEKHYKIKEILKLCVFYICTFHLSAFYHTASGVCYRSIKYDSIFLAWDDAIMGWWWPNG